MAKQATQVKENGPKAQVNEGAHAVSAGAVIPHVNPKAMQRDLGPQIVRMFAHVEEGKRELEELKAEISGKNYAAIAKLTKGVFDVAKADPNVALADHFSDDGKRKLYLNEALYLALGIKEIIKVGTGDSQVDRVVWAKSLKEFLPQYGEPTDTLEYEQKNTFRSNLAKQLNKAIGAALDIQKRKLEVRFDDKAQTLAISGPEVKKQFGLPEVMLNEKVSVQNDDGVIVKLKEKPSFQSLYNTAAASEGQHVKSGSNTRGPRPITDPSAVIVDMSTVFLNALGRAEADKLTKPAIDALNQIRDKIDALLV